MIDWWRAQQKISNGVILEELKDSWWPKDTIILVQQGSCTLQKLDLVIALKKERKLITISLSSIKWFDVFVIYNELIFIFISLNLALLHRALGHLRPVTSTYVLL